MMTVDLLNRLRNINWNFVKGEISEMTIDIDKSHAEQGVFVGTVTRRFGGGMRNDVRHWSCDGRTVTFLGRKRVLYVRGGRGPAFTPSVAEAARS